jgi:hypothetical protein
LVDSLLAREQSAKSLVFPSSDVLEVFPMTSRSMPSRLVREAGDRLLRAIKEKILREQRRVDVNVMRRRGFSEELITRLLEV